MVGTSDVGLKVVGDTLGKLLGKRVGVGAMGCNVVGTSVGLLLGAGEVGRGDGALDGEPVGIADGDSVGHCGRGKKISKVKILQN